MCNCNISIQKKRGRRKFDTSSVSDSTVQVNFMHKKSYIGKLIGFNLDTGRVLTCPYLNQEELVLFHADAKKEYGVIVTHVCKSGVNQFTPKLK